MTAKIDDKNPLYSLISLEDFKAVLGIDDREDKLARFCLVTSTFTIEQYCKRRFLRKKHFDRIELYGDLYATLKEYPVREVIAVYAIGNGDIIEPELYSVIPDCGTDEDIPFSISLSPAVARMGYKAIKAVYLAGYAQGKVPADLSAACLELASWNMDRYRGRRIGIAGNVKGGGKDSGQFELSMPENVKALLEPYKRRVI